MASTFAGSTATQHASGVPSSMLGFGPSSSPFYGASDQGQRLQYYSSQQHSSGPGRGEPVGGGRRSGKVKFFDSQKGFGFINDYRAEELGNEEVFVHYTSITAKSGFRSLAEGEEAEYELIRGPKGFQASNVTGPGGQQVVGDIRGRINKNAFLQMSPYGAMYPYIQQDPAAFYAAASPYNQPVMLIPPTDFRTGPGAHASPAAFRPHLPYPGVPSPYTSPASVRPYDIGKDFAGINLNNLSLNDSSARPKPVTNSAPFGGMFGSVPGFDTASSSSLSSPFPGPGSLPSRNVYQQQSTQSNSISNRSNSLENGEKGNSAVGQHRESLGDRPADAAVNRPQALHTRSSSLLYASKPSNNQ